MSPCETCGNEYDDALVIKTRGEEHVFDSFECAIHALAPRCDHCGVRILGHGTQSDSKTYCSAHCARSDGQESAVDRVA